MTPRISVRLVMVLAATLLLGVSCGPVTYVGQVTRDATTELEAARKANADKWAPYHFTLAVEYIHEARRQAGYANFAAANSFGKKSAEAARTAAKLSAERAADPDKAREALPPESLNRDAMAPLDTEASEGGADDGGDTADDDPAANEATDAEEPSTGEDSE